MDRRAARREAWWRAAQAVRSTLASGWDLGETYPDEREATLVEEELAAVIAIMERRGHL